MICPQSKYRAVRRFIGKPDATAGWPFVFLKISKFDQLGHWPPNHKPTDQEFRLYSRFSSYLEFCDARDLLSVFRGEKFPRSRFLSR
jgi:hypothetical protein